MLQLEYKPFDFDYYDKNFLHTEAVEWPDGVLTDSAYADLQRIGVAPSVLGWEKSRRRAQVLPRALLELRIAGKLGLRELIVDGYRHFQQTRLVLIGPYEADGVPNCVVLGELRQDLLVTSLADYENPDVGFLDHETNKATWWYDGLSDVLARASRAPNAAAPGPTPIGFVAHADEATPDGWPRMKPALRNELARLGALLPGTIAGKRGPVAMPRATLQLLGAGGAFIVGAVGALRDGDAVRFGPVSSDVGTLQPGLLPIGTVGPDRFVLIDLDDPHLENPGLFVTGAGAPDEIGRVTELFAAAKAFAS
jgi:hypothetical protein